MLAKRIIPCLDIKDGQTVKGINFLNIQEVGDPVELGEVDVGGASVDTDQEHVLVVAVGGGIGLFVYGLRCEQREYAAVLRTFSGPVHVVKGETGVTIKPEPEMSLVAGDQVTTGKGGAAYTFDALDRLTQVVSGWPAASLRSSAASSWSSRAWIGCSNWRTSPYTTPTAVPRTVRTACSRG